MCGYCMRCCVALLYATVAAAVVVGCSVDMIVACSGADVVSAAASVAVVLTCGAPCILHECAFEVLRDFVW